MQIRKVELNLSLKLIKASEAFKIANHRMGLRGYFTSTITLYYLQLKRT